MIVIFPMLTSSTIDKNVLPGIAKALELYAIAYLLEDVIKTETKKKVSLNPKTKRLLIEQVSSKGGNVEVYTPGGKPPTPPKTGPQPRSGKPSPPPARPLEPPKVTVNRPWATDISLPPTWITVDTPSGSKMVGIKVLPFRAKSDEDFVNSIGSDLSKNGSMLTLEKWMRGLKRFFLNVMPKKGISGDVEKDVIYARTKFGRNVFTLYDFTSVKNIVHSPSDVRKLFKLYWSSMIFADDANQMAYFCMKHFAGICNALPYQFLFSLSNQTSKVYEDLTSAQSTATSIFSRKKKHLTKLLGEAYAAKKVIDYSQYLLENKQEK